jgi:hypothetical protein
MKPPRRHPQIQPPISEQQNRGEQIRWCADAPIIEGLQLFAGGNGDPIKASDRSSLLERLRKGETVELELEAITFLQRTTPNRNYVRFKPGMLAAFAKSFEGQPMLRDHSSWSMLARGGTIVASKLEHNEDGSKQIRMRLKLVKPWAVESALDGTLDRFSIGWSRTGIVECSICEAALAKCDHWPGDRMSDGSVCEAVFTAADGTEVSGVNVPAVVGTRVQSISQLEAIDDPALLADILGTDATGSAGKEHDMKTLATMIAALGLPANATEDDVAAAVQANAAKLAIAEKADAEKATKLASIEAAEKKKTEDAERIAVETAIKTLIDKGKLKPGSADETELRAFAAQSMDLFAYAVKTKLGAPSVTPVGAPLPALAVDPNPQPMTDYAAAKASNPHLAVWMKKAGISEADAEKHSAGAVETVAAIQASR